MKTLYKITFLLLTLVIVLGIFDYFIGDESFIQDYLRGTITETVGIILTIILIEIILGKNREHINLENEKKKLIRINTVIKIYLEKHNESAFYLSYSDKDLMTKKKFEIEENFPFSNLSELFYSSRSGFGNVKDTKAGEYFNKVDILKEIIRTTLFQVDLTNFPELSKLLQNYLVEIESFYPKESILNDLVTKIGDNNQMEKMTDYIKKKIENFEGEVEYSTSEFLLNKYIRLYKILKYHMYFNKEYEKLIRKYLK